jgi:hypothetical protein
LDAFSVTARTFGGTSFDERWTLPLSESSHRLSSGYLVESQLVLNGVSSSLSYEQECEYPVVCSRWKLPAGDKKVR